MATAAPNILDPETLRRVLAGETFTRDGYTYRRYSPFEAQYVPGAEGGGQPIPEDSWTPQRVRDGQIEHYDRSGNYSTTTEDGYSKWGLRDLAKVAAIVGGGYLVGTALAGVGSAGAATGAAGTAAAPGTVAPLSMAELTGALAPTNSALAAGGAGLEAGSAGNVLSSLVQSVGPAIAMKVLAGEVKPPANDPALAAAIQGQLDLAKSAESRATANDDYWKANFAPRLLENMDTSTRLSKELQDFEIGRAKRYDDRYWNTTAKYQDSFYRDVDKYNTDAERERIAGEAIGDVRRGFSTARAIAGRDLARMGINPGSGRYAGQIKQLALDEALAGSAAGTQARRAAEDKGLSLKLTAAGLNSNLPGATSSATAGAGSAANIASQGIGTASTAWGANNAGYNGTMQLAQGAYGALGGLGSGLTNAAWQANVANTNQRNQIIGAGLGMLNFGR